MLLGVCHYVAAAAAASVLLQWQMNEVVIPENPALAAQFLCIFVFSKVRTIFF